MKKLALITILAIVLLSINAFAQEADPQQRLNQVNAQILRIDGMIEYNGLVRNEAAKAFATLTEQKNKLVATRDVLMKKIKEKTPDPIEEK